MANRDGELFEFNVFAATPGHSRRHVYIRPNTRTADDLVRCMYLTIMRLGGVPRERVTDNMSALVTLKGGRRSRVGRVWAFAKDAGFELKLGRPRSPQTRARSSRPTGSCPGSWPTRAISTGGRTSTR